MDFFQDVVLLTLFSASMFVLAPFLGMLAMGIGRKMGARMQNRVGPPVLQPWYDVNKLLMKEETASNPLIGPMAFAFFIFNALAVVVLVTLGDLLMVLVLMGTAQLFVSLGGFAGSAPYSHIGASRNLLQVLAVEPLLLATALAVLLLDGSFFVRELAWNSSVLLYFPMALVILLFALVVWMQKGPFDLSTAHQEVFYGPLSEFSGKNLALVEMGHWFEYFGLLAVFSLFFNLSPAFKGLLDPALDGWTLLLLAVVLDLVVKVLVALAALMTVTLIDNATTRLHWDALPKFSFYIVWPLAFANLVLVYAFVTWGWF